MIESRNIDVPASALVIVAHPDDAEFQAGATLAKWARSGTVVNYLIVTDGSKGTWDPSADPTELVELRQSEQRAAATALGATGVVRFLGLIDGESVVDHDSIGRTAQVIREVAPDVILGHDPWKRYRLHPDHRRAGELCVEGIIAARDPLFYPEQLTDGLEPHRPSTLLLFEPDEVNHVEEVTEDDHLRRLAALESFGSQFTTTHLYRVGETDPDDPNGRRDRDDTASPHQDHDAEIELFRSAERRKLEESGMAAGVELAELFHIIVDQL